jgi:hypothetical protein
MIARIDVNTGEAATDGEGLVMAALERHGSPEFTVRAKKRMAQIRARQLRLKEAAEQLDSALKIATANHVLDQIADFNRFAPRGIRTLFQR